MDKNRTKNPSGEKASERVVSLIFLFFGVLCVGLVLLISIYLVISGLPAMIKIGPIKFLFGTTWSVADEEFGILPFILTSIYGAAGALLLGVPVGITRPTWQSGLCIPFSSTILRIIESGFLLHDFPPKCRCVLKILLIGAAPV